MKKVLITGIAGQDGSFLADLLLGENYEVHGLVRSTSTGKYPNLSHILDRIRLHRGDITDPVSLSRIIQSVEPDYIYHEADQDNVGDSFKTPAYSMDVTIKAVTNLLEIIKELPGPQRPKLFLPSSATIFGNTSGVPQDEQTRLNPQSPYAIGKAAVLHLGNLYRNIHGLKIVTGILYNHDSDRRNGSYFLHDVCRIAVECSLGLRNDTGDRFSDVDAEINIGEARKYMEVAVKLMEGGYYDNYIIGSQFSIPAEYWIKLAFSEVQLDYRNFLLKANPKKRPGLPEVYIPITKKVESHLQIHPITTNQFTLVESLIAKYKRNYSEALSDYSRSC